MKRKKTPNLMNIRCFHTVPGVDTRLQRAQQREHISPFLGAVIYIPGKKNDIFFVIHTSKHRELVVFCVAKNSGQKMRRKIESYLTAEFVVCWGLRWKEGGGGVLARGLCMVGFGKVGHNVG